MNSAGYPLYNVIIRSLTWGRDSHGLFDYQSKNVYKTDLKAYGSCIILRKENEVNLCTAMSPHPQYSADSKPLASLFQTDTGLFFVKPVGNEQLWLVVRRFKQSVLENSYKLSGGEVFKFGRVKFRVRSIRKPYLAEIDEIDNEALVVDSNLGSEDKICRICLLNEIDSTNPMISPCRCSGSYKYIHFNCLARWLSSKLVVTSDFNVSFYYWKSTACELCKQEFPMSINHQGKIRELFTFEKPSIPYLTLEPISKKENSKSIYVIHLTTNNSISLGRGHASDLRISDISVSKIHAFISFRNGSFYLEDNRSKFGTLIEVSEGYALDPSSQIALQMGRTVISFSVKNEGQGNSNELDSLNMPLVGAVAEPDFEED